VKQPLPVFVPRTHVGHRATDEHHFGTMPRKKDGRDERKDGEGKRRLDGYG
jgi:hypothetical protein